MTFQDLEARLKEEGSYNHFSKILREIKQQGRVFGPEAEMIKYFLTVSNIVDKSHLEDTAYIGGYGVLTHLIGTFGEDVIPFWHGSEDLDIVTLNPSTKNIIMGTFSERISRQSHLPNKYALEVRDEDSQEDMVCKIDLYMPSGKERKLNINDREIRKDFFDRSEEHKVFGVSSVTAPIEDLFGLKMDVRRIIGKLRTKDIHDLVNITSVLMRRGYDSQQVYNLFKEDEWEDPLIEDIYFSNIKPLVTIYSPPGWNQKEYDGFIRDLRRRHNMVKEKKPK